MPFRLSSTAFEPSAWQSQLARAHAGAFVSFEGWVRDRNDGRAVVSLEYEAFAELAEREGERILAEARKKFSITDALCVHRVGHLRIGDLAVWIGVTAEHRASAFEACRYIIDEAKARLPIWKKEYYADGGSIWVNHTGQRKFAAPRGAPRRPLKKNR